MEDIAVNEAGGCKMYFGFLAESSKSYFYTQKDNLHYAATLRSEYNNSLPMRLLGKASSRICVDTSSVPFLSERMSQHTEESDWSCQR